MHLLSKHKFYASADKLFHEFFTIINKSDNEKIELDASLSTVVAIAVASQQAQGIQLNELENEHQQKLNEQTEKSANLKRALIDANILPQVTVEASKKTRLSDTVENTQLRANLTYDTEVLDDGSTIYICSKCKLVFLQTQALYEHKCFQAFNDATSDTSLQLNNSSSNPNVNDNSLYNENCTNDQNLINNLKNEVNSMEKHGKGNDLDEDYDNLKNSSDIIYME